MPDAEPTRIEIERRFLVADSSDRVARQATAAVVISQGYLVTDPDRTVRVRVAGERGWLTIKGRRQAGVAPEFEYEIPAAEARELLAMCLPGRIDKTRHTLAGPDGREWVVDEFAGDNAGLVIAELELATRDDRFEAPAWLGREITTDARYANSQLAERPFCSWSAADRDEPRSG
ncbi:MAG: CYTH domain-containing protein [bacterium]|nr:CYTH domain-containing protein [bacterium]